MIAWLAQPTARRARSGSRWSVEQLGEIALPFLDELTRSTGEGTSVGAWIRGTVTIAAKREPGGPVWVMQEYTKTVDPSLDIDNLHRVGSKLKNLPAGWTFETKVLTEELSLDTMRSDGWASIIRDELGCTYQACGYGADSSANYVP